MGETVYRNPDLEYDREYDAVWIVSEGEKLARIPRNTIIAMVGVLPSEPPRMAEDARAALQEE